MPKAKTTVKPKTAVIAVVAVLVVSAVAVGIGVGLFPGLVPNRLLVSWPNPTISTVTINGYMADTIWNPGTSKVLGWDYYNFSADSDTSPTAIHTVGLYFCAGSGGPCTNANNAGVDLVAVPSGSGTSGHATTSLAIGPRILTNPAATPYINPDGTAVIKICPTYVSGQLVPDGFCSWSPLIKLAPTVANVLINNSGLPTKWAPGTSKELKWDYYLFSTSTDASATAVHTVQILFCYSPGGPCTNANNAGIDLVAVPSGNRQSGIATTTLAIGPKILNNPAAAPYISPDGTVTILICPSYSSGQKAPFGWCGQAPTIILPVPTISSVKIDQATTTIRWEAGTSKNLSWDFSNFSPAADTSPTAVHSVGLYLCNPKTDACIIAKNTAGTDLNAVASGNGDGLASYTIALGPKILTNSALLPYIDATDPKQPQGVIKVCPTVGSGQPAAFGQCLKSPVFTIPTCGDSICDPLENAISCAADCMVCLDQNQGRPFGTEYSGKTLTLTKDLSVKTGSSWACLVINKATDFTLDCNGHTINGSNRSFDGIIVFHTSNITIKNCTLQNFATAIWAEGVNNLNIRDNTIRSSTIGLSVEDSSATIVYNTIENNDTGFRVFAYADGKMSVNNNNIANNNILNLSQLSNYDIAPTNIYWGTKDCVEIRKKINPPTTKFQPYLSDRVENNPTPMNCPTP